MDMEIRFPGGKRVDALYKGYTITTDQPTRSGGDGSAPAPFDLFMASIGTCAGFYVLAFCQTRAIPTEDVKIVLRTEKDGETRMIRKITIEIRLPPGFPEKYRKAVVRSAKMCTVTKHMLDPPLFDVYVTSQGDRQ